MGLAFLDHRFNPLSSPKRGEIRAQCSFNPLSSPKRGEMIFDSTTAHRFEVSIRLLARSPGVNPLSSPKRGEIVAPSRATKLDARFNPLSSPKRGEIRFNPLSSPKSALLAEARRDPPGGLIRTIRVIPELGFNPLSSPKRGEMGLDRLGSFQSALLAEARRDFFYSVRVSIRSPRRSEERWNPLPEARRDPVDPRRSRFNPLSSPKRGEMPVTLTD